MTDDVYSLLDAAALEDTVLTLLLTELSGGSGTSTSADDVLEVTAETLSLLVLSACGSELSAVLSELLSEYEELNGSSELSTELSQDTELTVGSEPALDTGSTLDTEPSVDPVLNELSVLPCPTDELTGTVGVTLTEELAEEVEDNVEKEPETAGAFPISITFTPLFVELSARSVEHPAKTQNDSASNDAAEKFFLIVFPQIIYNLTVKNIIT